MMSRELRLERTQRERERVEAARKRELFAQDLRALSALPEGRRTLRWLLEQGGIFEEGYIAGEAGAFRAGQRSVALRLWNALAAILPAEEFLAVQTPVSEYREETDEKEIV